MPVLTLRLQPDRFSVCQLPAHAAIPAWASAPGAFTSITRTAEELSIVCPGELTPIDVKQEGGWRLFQVEGPLDFGLTGIMTSVLDPLAKANISVFPVSTYNTDYVLVKAENASAATSALRNAGHTVHA